MNSQDSFTFDCPAAKSFSEKSICDFGETENWFSLPKTWERRSRRKSSAKATDEIRKQTLMHQRQKKVKILEPQSQKPDSEKSESEGPAAKRQKVTVPKGPSMLDRVTKKSQKKSEEHVFVKPKLLVRTGLRNKVIGRDTGVTQPKPFNFSKPNESRKRKRENAEIKGVPIKQVSKLFLY